MTQNLHNEIEELSDDLKISRKNYENIKSDYENVMSELKK